MLKAIRADFRAISTNFQDGRKFRTIRLCLKPAHELVLFI